MICVVIPTLNSSTSLDELLAQFGDLEVRVVVTDGGSDDDTLEVAARHRAVLAVGTPGRGTQLRRGCRWVGEADWVLVLHSDSRLTPNWRDCVDQHILNYPTQAGYFDLRFDSPRWQARVVEFWVKIRSNILGLPYGDQGLIISKELYETVGGYEDIPLFEDVAIVKALGLKRLKSLGQNIVTQPDKFERDGYFIRGWRNLRLLRRYLKGVPIETLRKAYK